MVGTQSPDKDLYRDEIFDALPDPVIAVTAHGVVTYVNPAFAALLGDTPQRWLNQYFNLPSTPLPSSVEPQTEAPSIDPPIEIETCYRTQTQNVWVAWKPIPNVTDTRSDQNYFLGRDITSHRVKASTQIARRRDAEQANSAKSAFLAMMSHEIRTPMNGVLGMTRLLLDTELSAEQKNYAQKIDQSGDALMSLLNDILDYSKIEAGKIELDIARFNLYELIQDVIELLATKAHEKNIEIAAVIDDDSPQYLLGDGPRLRQVLLNLINNAIKFTESGGIIIRVKILSRPVDDSPPKIRIEIDDTGIGIAHDVLPSIFNEFTQADTSHASRFGGSGLGLAISKKLITAMNGQLGVTSREGEGSTFWLECAFAPAEKLPFQSELPKLIGLKTLLVSNCPITTEAVTSQLSHVHIPTIRCQSPQDALRHLKSNDQDHATTVIFDLKSDSEDALIFMHQLKRISSDGIRALALISPDHRSKIDNLLRQGYSGYLLKPLRQRALVERIQYVHGLVDTQADIVTISKAITAEQNLSKSQASKPQRVLVAEDNAINQALIASLLKKAGHEVTITDNGQHVLDKLAEGSFDLILMDIRMPKMDGLEATRKIRNREAAWSQIPIIALTANAQEEDRQAALDAGMNDFVTKPIDPTQLHRLIERWTNSDSPVKLQSTGNQRV